jgi:hypothetical protein
MTSGSATDATSSGLSSKTITPPLAGCFARLIESQVGRADAEADVGVIDAAVIAMRAKRNRIDCALNLGSWAGLAEGPSGRPRQGIN